MGENGNFAIQLKEVCLLEFHVLATFTVISERVPTSDNAHSWRLYSGAQHHDQSHYLDTRQTRSCYILVTLS